ncbi:MAG: class II aldolase/adducin family protein [Firmicutes bacterium]|nr:class II aldolase/adducin family protein [Bacillota bacterium]
MDERTVREQLVAAAQFLKNHGLLFRGEHANLSQRLDEDRIVMTRGGSIGQLTVEDLAVVGLSGRVLSEGAMDPTMQEVIDMHTRIYRARKSVGAVIHAHSPHLTAFAVAGKALPLVYEPLLRFGLTEPVPVVPWAPRGSQESVDAIVAWVEGHSGIWAVLMANHGPLVFHEDILSAARLLATLDEAAELVWKAQALGGAQPLPEAAVDAVRARMALFGSRR